MHSPKRCHLKIALRLLRHLKSSPGKGVSFVKSKVLDLKGFSDADWAKCLFSRKSVSGYLVYFGSSLISWRSKKQDTISRSSTESEYRALGSASCEIILILKVLHDLGYSKLVPVDLLCDNESAIKLALNPIFHDKTKHFEVDVHFIREKIAKCVIQLVKVESKENVSDILTKSLVSCQHEYFSGKMGLVDPFDGNST